MISHAKFSHRLAVGLGSGLLLVGAANIGAQEKPGGGNAVAEIRAVLDAQAQAWNRGDINGYMNGYARGGETEFVSGEAVTRGWETVRDRYAKKYDSREKMGTLSFSEVRIEPLSPDVALVTGGWQLVRKEDKPHGRFTLLLRRTGEGWRIVYDHTSAAAP